MLPGFVRLFPASQMKKCLLSNTSEFLVYPCIRFRVENKRCYLVFPLMYHVGYKKNNYYEIRGGRIELL